MTHPEAHVLAHLLTIEAREVIAWCIGVAAAVYALVGKLWRWPVAVFRWCRRTVNRWGGVLDTLAGRPPIVDRATGREVAPAQPPLAHRFDGMEQQMRTLTEVVVSQRHQDERLDTHERVFREHGMWPAPVPLPGEVPPAPMPSTI